MKKNKKYSLRRYKIPIRVRQALWGVFFISPWLVGFMTFKGGPIFSAIYFGFTRYDAMSHPVWLGLQNYKEILVDPLFWKSVYNTVYFVFFNVAFKMLFSLVLALLVNSKIRGISIFRTTFYLPMVVPVVATSILWNWILHPEFGVVNYLLNLLNLPDIKWIVTERWSKPSIVLVSLWRLGETMVIFLAGLQSIPEQVYEAAKIDGANAWTVLLRITIPLLTPTILFNLVISVIRAFQVFSFAYIITRGGPLNSSLFYMLYVFRQAFKYFNLGYASALAVILFTLLVLFTFVLMKSSRRWVYYEAE